MPDLLCPECSSIITPAGTRWSCFQCESSGPIEDLTPSVDLASDVDRLILICLLFEAGCSLKEAQAYLNERVNRTSLGVN